MSGTDSKKICPDCGNMMKEIVWSVLGSDWSCDCRVNHDDRSSKVLEGKDCLQQVQVVDQDVVCREC